MERLNLASLEKNSRIYFKIGLIISLSLTIMAFNYTVYDNKVYADMAEQPVIEETFEVIRTPPEKAKPLPTRPEVETREIEPIEKNQAFAEQPVSETIPLEIPLAKTNTKIAKPALPVIPKSEPKPPAPKPKEKTEAIPEVWKVVEEMPRFGDCATLSTREERAACSQKNLLAFVYSKIKYPALARETHIEGTVVLSFIIDETGKVTQPQIARDIGGGCGKEALRVVKLMPRWHAGRQRGKKVKVMFNLPVKFRLQ